MKFNLGNLRLDSENGVESNSDDPEQKAGFAGHFAGISGLSGNPRTVACLSINNKPYIHINHHHFISLQVKS